MISPGCIMKDISFEWYFTRYVMGWAPYICYNDWIFLWRSEAWPILILIFHVCCCEYIPTLTAVHTTKSRFSYTMTNISCSYLLKNDFDSRWHISEFVLCLSQLHWIHVRMALKHAVPHNYCFVKFPPYWFLVDIRVYS